MLKIYLTRHGQDQDNANGILNGHRDMPLTELGLSQATELAGKISDSGLKFDVVYCSPLQRAKVTAKIVCETLKVDPPHVLPELIERDFGVMAGKPVKDIESFCAPDIFKTETITYFLSPDGAETFPELMERAKKLLDKLSEKHLSGSILLVGHGDFGKMLYTVYYDLDWQAVLEQFHFGNSELLLLAEDSKPEDAHVFTSKQYNG